MEAIPAIDKFFNLEEALKDFGFQIKDKGWDYCTAYGYSYWDYGDIYIEFNQSFFQDGKPTDMRVFYYKREDDVPTQKTLFLGVAPTNQHDFDTLMQLLFPSDAFKDRL